MTDSIHGAVLFESGPIAERVRNLAEQLNRDDRFEISFVDGDPTAGLHLSPTENTDDLSTFPTVRAHEAGSETAYGPTDASRLEFSELVDIWSRLPDEERLAKVEALCTWLRAMYTMSPAVVGASVTTPTHATMLSEEGLPTPLAADGQLQDVSWLLLLPPETVAAHGREHLLGAPVWRTEELEDGGVLLVTTDDPEPPTARLHEPVAAERALAEHLAMDAGWRD